MKSLKSKLKSETSSPEELYLYVLKNKEGEIYMVDQEDGTKAPLAFPTMEAVNHFIKTYKFPMEGIIVGTIKASDYLPSGKWDH
jgi:hypothetical protein